MVFRLNPRAVVATIVALAMAVTTLAIADRTVAAVGVPTGTTDWSAARALPPLPPGQGSSAPLDLSAERALVELPGFDLATTTRPILTAEIDPDPVNGFEFVVFDVLGSGGLTEAVAAVTNHHEPTWSPASGLLQHGHVYAWTVVGADDEAQDWGAFTVDVHRSSAQAYDPFGPFDVGLSTGELGLDLSFSGDDDDVGLHMTYRTAEQAGRERGSTPRRVMSNGWELSGSMLGDASYHRIQPYAGGEAIVAHALNGTSLRFDRNERGEYVPTGLDDGDPGFLQSTLTPLPDGGHQLTDVSGATSTFASDGMLESFDPGVRAGSAARPIDLDWSAGLLRSVTDRMTGRTATLTYLGEQGCPHLPGFDTGAPTPALCSVTTFTGETVELYYHYGDLVRVITGGDAVIDFAYDEAGKLVSLREPLAADAIAAGVVENAPDATWRIAYDSAGRVEQITSPRPAADADSLVHRYEYGEGVTRLFAGGHLAGTVEYDPADYRVLTIRSTETDVPLVYVYDEDRTHVGLIDERGLQTGWSVTDRGNITEVWGPAPSAWFGTDGRPLGTHADGVPTRTQEYEAGRGAITIWSDGISTSGEQRAQSLLTTSTVESLPSSVDAGDGWRMLLLGAAELPLEGDVEWRFRVDPTADDSSIALVNSNVVNVDEIVELEASDADVVDLTISYGSLSAPSPSAPAWFELAYRIDDGEWQSIDVSSMIGTELLSAVTTTDVYAAGGAPSTNVLEIDYADELLGLPSTELLNGGVIRSYTHQDADPAAGQYAFPLTASNEAGLTSARTYYGPDDTATHPITGETVRQHGGLASVRMGGGSVYGFIYDASGSVVGYTTDGAVTTAIDYDERGRMTTLERTGTPTRTMTMQYGAGGDPLVTASTTTVGGEEFVSLVRVDLLGRTVESTDTWGTTTTARYDGRDALAAVEHVTANGERSSTEFHVDPATGRMTGSSIQSFDGSQRTTTVERFDAAGRPVELTYSNGLHLTIEYDGVTGQPIAHVWRNEAGDTWTDRLTTTTQSGRILEHSLTTPHGSAAFAYTYDPTSAALTEATVAGTGDGPIDTAWSWVVERGIRLQKSAVDASGTTVLEYDYDADLVPTAVREIVTATDGAVDERSVPLTVEDGAITQFDATVLQYDSSGLLLSADDGTRRVELTRDASGAIVRETVVEGGLTSTRLLSGPFALAESGAVVSEAHALPGGVSLALDADEASWAVTTTTGDLWWTTDDTASPDGVSSYYSPDGELLAGEHVAPGEPASATGWRMEHSGTTLALDTSVVIFSARAYVPTLGLFTTTDPVTHAGPTPYTYADNDPVNLVDPTGWSAEGWFDDWNSPGTQMLIVYGLTLLAMFLSFLGPVGLVIAAILMILVAVYQIALGVDAYLAGDYELAAMYWVNAGFSLAFAAGFAWGARSAIMTARAKAAAAAAAPAVTAPVTAAPRALKGSTHGASGTSYHSLATRRQYHHAQRQDAIITNNLYAGGLAGGGGAPLSPFWSHVATLALASIVPGIALITSTIWGYYVWEEKQR